MKKVILSFFLLIPFFTYSQLVVSVKDGEIQLDKTKLSNAPKKIVIENTTLQDFTSLEIEENTNLIGEISTTTGKISYKVDIPNKKIQFCIVGESSDDKCKDVFWCTNTYSIEKCEQDNQLKDFTQLPFPVFSYSNTDDLPNLKDRNKRRYLIIDATPNPFQKRNNTLYRQLKKDGTNLKEASSIPVASSLAILIKNYRFHNLKKIQVDINEEDYSYAVDIQDLRQQAFADTSKKDAKKTDGRTSGNRETQEEQKARETKRITTYLDSVYKYLNKNNYLNLNDLKQLEYYKKDLQTVMDRMNKKGVVFTAEDMTIISKILNWYPEYVALTPISIEAPDADEVSIQVRLQWNGNTDDTEYKVGTFRTTGGLGIGVNNMLVITGLKNNTVFTDSADFERTVVDASGVSSLDTVTGLVAKMPSQNQLSLGIGATAEISFRTGSIIRPTIVTGFFVPFGQDLTPFFTLGAGLSLGTKRVKLSCSSGLAFGSVNVISEQYQGKDLTKFDNLLNEQLVEKAWKCNWQVSIGVSYNLANTK
jgi:hypothetical protein